MNKTKGFNYDTEKHKHIIEHIKKQPNQSQYIWDLVEQDMNSGNLESKIKKILAEMLEKGSLSTNKKEVQIDTSSIKDILDM